MQRIIDGSQRGVKRARGPCWELLAKKLKAQPELCPAAGPYVCRNLVAALMNAARQNKESDLVLLVPERDGAGQHEKVFMHRALARLMFREETCKTIKNVEARQAEITLTDEFDKVVIEAVVEWLYTGALPSDLTCETALPLLRAAEFYMQTSMLEPLCAWLAENMQPLEAVFVFDAADTLCECSRDRCLLDLRTEAMRVIARNLPDVLASGVFPKFPRIVKHLNLVPCEQAAFDVAKQIAESGSPEALEHVAFGKINKAVLSRNLAFIESAVAASPTLAAHFVSSLIRPSSRREYSLAGAILAITADGAAFAFVPASEKMYHLAAIFPESETASAPAVCDAGLALAVVNGKILVVVLNDCNRQVYAYDEGRASWVYQGETRWHSVTNSAAAVSPDGRLVLLGGEHDVDADKDCEVLSTEGKWEYFRPLPEARSGGCAGFVGTDLYYVAGQHNEDGPADEVFVSPDSEHQFVIAGRLNRPRWNFAAAFVENKIYCFGGDFLTLRFSCEVYDVTTNTSRMIADAPSDGANMHSAWHRDGSVYVVERTRLLKYSIAENAWEIVSDKFPFCAKAISFE
jgi:hypothetical protein